MSPNANSQPDQRSHIPDSSTGIAEDKGLPITDHRSASGGKRKVVLAIASAGGHWVQLQRLRPAFEGCRLIYSTTKASYAVNLDGAEFRLAPDGNMWLKWRLLRCAIKTAWTIFTLRPDVIVSTGAAPGYFALVYGKLLGKKTIWVDSIANAEELSLSGKKLSRFADLWLTQWEHLAKPEGPHFFGNVLGDEDKKQITDHRSTIHDLVQPAISHKPSGQSSAQQSSISNQPSDAVGTPPDSRSPITDYRSEPKLRIFVTIGTDLPFNRLIDTIDNWAAENPEHQVFAQIGDAGNEPKNISFAAHIEPTEYKKRFEEADLVISHAGMGTILTSLIENKPLLVLPRIAALGEHRNEHQLATALHLQKLNRVHVAENETQLIQMLNSTTGLPAKSQIGPHASKSLIDKLKSFIAGTDTANS